MKNTHRVYFEDDNIVFEILIDWRELQRIAREQSPNIKELSSASLLDSVGSGLDDLDDLEELFRQFLADSSNEKANG